MGRDGCDLQRRDPAPEQWDLEVEADRYDICAVSRAGNTPTAYFAIRSSRRPQSSASWGASDMLTEPSDEGLLSIRYGEGMADPAGAAVPIDVIDEAFREVVGAPRVLKLGWPVQIRLHPGSYLIRAFLPSGEMVSRQTWVEPRGETAVLIVPSKPPPRESLMWAYVLKRVPHGGRAARDLDALTDVARFDLGTGGTGPEMEMLLWSAPRGPGIPGGGLGRWMLITAPPGETLMHWPRRQSTCWKARTGWRSAGPTSPRGSSRCRQTRRRGRASWSSPMIVRSRCSTRFDVMVDLGDGHAAAVLSYLATGALEPARRLGEPLVEQVEGRVARGDLPPIAAAVAGYYLLKASASDRPHDWTAALASAFPWMPDGPVIRAWHLLHLPDPDADEFRACWSRPPAAGSRSSPRASACSTTGSASAARTGPDDAPAPALESIRPYAAAANWSALMTTFYADDPRRPALPRRWLMSGTARVPVETNYELERYWRCLDRVDPPLYRDMLVSILDLGTTPEEAANELGIDRDPEVLYMEAMLALKEQLMSVL